MKTVAVLAAVGSIPSHLTGGEGAQLKWLKLKGMTKIDAVRLVRTADLAVGRRVLASCPDRVATLRPMRRDTVFIILMVSFGPKDIA